jgi:hypothetical protein
MNTTRILGRLLAMSSDEVMGMVSPRTIADIKREDPTPKILAFVIGQEGEAQPKVAGIGATLQRWYRSAIEALTSKLGLGAPVYNGHPAKGPDAKPADYANRQPIGEVVGKLFKRVGDAMSSIAAVYIYPQYQDIPFDVASIEAVVRVPGDAREFDVQEADIQEINGIALSNSAIDKPAFAGATLIAQLQAFAETNRPGGEKTMTLEEIRKTIQEGKHKPSDLFQIAELTSDPFMREHVEEKINNAKGYDIRKRQELETKVATLEAEKKTLQDELASHKSSSLKVQAREQFEAVLKERPALERDERLAKYVRKQFEKSFTPSEEAKLKDDLNKFMDTAVAEGQELFGEPGKAGDKSKGKTTPTNGKTSGDGKDGKDGDAGDGGGDGSLLDPKNNDLIPQD